MRALFVLLPPSYILCFQFSWPALPCSLPIRLWEVLAFVGVYKDKVHLGLGGVKGSELILKLVKRRYLQVGKI